MGGELLLLPDEEEAEDGEPSVDGAVTGNLSFADRISMSVSTLKEFSLLSNCSLLSSSFRIFTSAFGKLASSALSSLSLIVNSVFAILVVAFVQLLFSSFTVDSFCCFNILLSSLGGIRSKISSKFTSITLFIHFITLRSKNSWLFSESPTFEGKKTNLLKRKR